MLESIQQNAFRFKELDDPLFHEKGIRCFMHLQGESFNPLTGNKGYKLKQNILQAAKSGIKTLLSFGGAYSNHLYALAYTGFLFGFQTVGVVRGEAEYQSNPTLSQAARWGMRLHFVDRSEYRQRYTRAFQEKWQKRYPGALLIPEGGSNEAGVEGAKDLSSEWFRHTGWQPDYWCVAAGTGATAAGLIQASQGKCLVFSALKGARMEDAVRKYFTEYHPANKTWENFDFCHHGGFARMTIELEVFIIRFLEAHGILLDPIYTSKMMWGLYDLIRRDYFPAKTRILAYHSGGLQGWSGMISKVSQENQPVLQKLINKKEREASLE